MTEEEYRQQVISRLNGIIVFLIFLVFISIIFLSVIVAGIDDVNANLVNIYNGV